MANLLQSSQNKQTVAPSFYTDYLGNLATQGQAASGQAQFAGASPLQREAFCKAQTNFGDQQPAISTGQGLVGQAANQNVTGAAAPYLAAGTNASPLCAARPLICQSANLDLGNVASQYMSPYIQTAVQGLSDVAQRNIRNNLSPAATAAAVGSGQFGSQRGAQVLGQIQEQAQQDLNAKIAEMENTGYGQALAAAQAKQTALGQLANTTANAQQAQNQANLTAGQTASQAATNQGQLLNTAGTNMGTLAQTGANMNLACINALSTLGGQQQAIAQNQQNYPLTKLQSLASLLQGYSIPTSTKTTLCMSPLSGAAAMGTAGAAAIKCFPTIKSGLEAILNGSGGPAGAQGTLPVNLPSGTTDGYPADPGESLNTDLPQGTTDGFPEDTNFCDCVYFRKDGGSINARPRGFSGCASTFSRGALPYRKA